MKKVFAFLLAVILLVGCRPSYADVPELTRHLLRETVSRQDLIRDGFVEMSSVDPAFKGTVLFFLFRKVVQVEGKDAAMWTYLKANDGTFCANGISLLSNDSTPLLRDLRTALAPSLKQVSTKARWSPATKNLIGMALLELPNNQSNRVLEATITRTIKNDLFVNFQFVNRDPPCDSLVTTAALKLDRFQKLTAPEARADLDMVQQLSRAGWALD